MWFICTERMENEDVICFHKLSPMNKNFSRYIEKQLFITNGLYELTLIFSGIWMIISDFSNKFLWPDSSITLFLNGKQVSLQDAGLISDELDSVESLQVFLHDVNEIKCCRGSSPPSDFFKLKKSFGFGHARFSHHFWHKNCSTVIKDNEEEYVKLFCFQYIN